MMGLAALLLTTWAACSDDTDASGGENPEEARAYTTVTIAVPNGVAETRASDPTAARMVMYPPSKTLLASVNPMSSSGWSIAGVSPLSNNVYQVTVTGIQGVGKDGVTEDIITDTETDDPTTVLLNVKLSIKPWVVRANGAVLGR